MASMAELARQLLGMNGNSVGGVSPDRYMEVMDRSPYGTGVPLEIGYGEQDQMSPLDAAAMVTGGVPVVGDLTGLAADVDMYMRDPESRNIPNYLLTAAGALPFLPAASQVRQGIKAYHGSPYNFPPVRELEMPDGAVVYQSMDDVVPEGAQVIAEHPLGRFDMSKIGTGEGAQAYGRGLYFAEAEKTAKGYRDALKGNMVTTSDGVTKTYGQHITEVEDAIRAAHPNLNPDNIRAAAKSVVDDNLTDADVEGMGQWEGVYKSGIAANKNAQASKGSMYEVNIDVEPDELIEWDELIDEQPSKVLDKLEKSDWWEYAEEGIYDRAGARGDNPTGADLIRWLEEDGGEYAAEALKDLGIKGIRYADAFTRHKTPDKRSMNYVIFDPRLISIAKKYGIAIPAAAAMLARQTGEDTSQSYQEAI
jgi:hypothetical protein